MTAPNNSLFTLRTPPIIPEESLRRSITVHFYHHNSDRRRPILRPTSTVAAHEYFRRSGGKLCYNSLFWSLPNWWPISCISDLVVLSFWYSNVYARSWHFVIIQRCFGWCFVVSCAPGVWLVYWIHEAMQGLSRRACWRAYLGSVFSCGC